MKQYREYHSLYDDPASPAPAESQEATQEEGVALANGPESAE